MKPGKYIYLAPSSKAELLQWKAKYGSDCRVIAGGQSLVPMMNFRLVTPSALIDLNRLPELAYIREKDGTISIGAMTRYRTVEFSQLVNTKLPLLSDAIHHVAHLPIRTRGTLGGSLAHADPAAEMPMTLLALEGTVIAESIRGSREIAAADLFVSMFSTSIEADEVITEIRFPVMSENSAYAVEEFSRRTGDFAIAAIAVNLDVESRNCTRARIATAGVGDRQVRLPHAESVLEGAILTPEIIGIAAREAALNSNPQTDLQASAEFRRHLTEMLCSRAVLNALKKHGRKVPSV